MPVPVSLAPNRPGIERFRPAWAAGRAQSAGHAENFTRVRTITQRSPCPAVLAPPAASPRHRVRGRTLAPGTGRVRAAGDVTAVGRRCFRQQRRRLVGRRCGRIGIRFRFCHGRTSLKRLAGGTGWFFIISDIPCARSAPTAHTTGAEDRWLISNRRWVYAGLAPGQSDRPAAVSMTLSADRSGGRIRLWALPGASGNVWRYVVAVAAVAAALLFRYVFRDRSA